MTSILALLFLFQAQVPAQAPQTAISGVVLRATNGEPIAGAQVIVTRTSFAGAADPAAVGARPATRREADRVIPRSFSTGNS
jgi:hypothetical protein